MLYRCRTADDFRQFLGNGGLAGLVVDQRKFVDDGTGVVGYKVFRDGNPIPVGITTATVFVDSGLVANSLYTYTVSAYDAASPSNESQASDPPASTTTQAALPRG